MPEPKRKFILDEEITEIYSYHVPQDPHTGQLHHEVRTRCEMMAHWLNTNLPDCPEKTVLIRQKLREVMMYANAIVAISGPSEEFRAAVKFD